MGTLLGMVRVYYRIGSLEKTASSSCSKRKVYYLIGSLENLEMSNQAGQIVYYRIGSLEMNIKMNLRLLLVHYRRGSLEKDFFIRNLNCSKFDLYSFLFYYLLGDAE
ncbi:hypothetical protein [Acinetobacter bereziniae]|uniref:hypothetical protein n=1 Tax=Acinetobacter bereziniae TaxID=106648 RepID=UPI0012FE5328|nr:hypothetical protein [Acinetobacter bereziniae]